MQHVWLHCRCVVSSNVRLIVYIMARRNDHAITNTLTSVAHALHGQQNLESDEFSGLRKFQRNNPPMFKGMYDMEGAHAWLKEIEKNFRVMAYTEEHKVLFGTHMLSEEAEDWWDNAR